MGPCMSALKSRDPVIGKTDIDGTDDDYHKRFIEESILGKGEFGVVKLVRDMTHTNDNTPYACKIIRKGLTFKDNTLYAPIARSALRDECNILRILAGKHHCLKLQFLYECGSFIYVVTEFCSGGEMLDYIVKVQSLRTEDVSRIAYQLLDAVNHCHKHNIVHRDIKPENVMFKHAMDNAPLRLIDFGSSSIEAPLDQDLETLPEHSTFAGSAFYISPEMFQRTYTQKTDLWSVGASLYVLVAGYPADMLQKAFNILHSSKDRDLRSLPNLPEDLPDSYFELLEDLLFYRHKGRKSAEEVLKTEFVQFHIIHQSQEEDGIDIHEISNAAAGVGEFSNSSGSRKGKTTSMDISGSVYKHTLFLGYQKFERSVTTLLATVLSRDDLQGLFDTLNDKILGGTEVEKKLRVVKISELKDTLDMLSQTLVINMINKLPDSDNYDAFAFHMEILGEFMLSRKDTKKKTTAKNGVRRGKSGLIFAKSNASGLNDSNSSHHVNASVSGGNVWERFKGSRKSPAIERNNDALNISSHI